MNTLDVLSASSATRKAPIREKERRPVDDSRTDDIAEKRAERARFAKVLALLAGAGESTRSQLLQQMPAGNASLLDRLLAQADQGLANETTDASSAASALRYGMLSGAANERLTGGSLLGERDGERSTSLADSQIIAKLTQRRGLKVEELLARGDSNAAEIQRALDVLLAQAGTAAGHAVASEHEANAYAAHASSLAAAHVRSAADVTTPVKDADALTPEFRSRLERVIDRMKSEFGHDVQIVETARSQERQDHLFEQGRTRGGPVVTWTRDSAHISGNAADLLVDGKWNNMAGYENLQRIAREEGLRTLGMRDPGHLELPRDARASQEKTLASLNGSTHSSDASLGGAKGIASVASVAGVAQVAQVASQQGVSTYQTNSAAASSLSNSSVSTGSTDTTGSNAGNSDSKDKGNDRTSDESAAAIYNLRSSTASSAGQPSSELRTTTVGPDTFDRVMEAQRVRENAAARPVSQLKLEVDTPDGGKDEITIGMRGNSVSTQIVTDARSAERMRMRTGELQDALGKHGLEADTVRISGSARQDSTESSKSLLTAADREAAKVGVAQQSQQGDGTNGQHSRDRNASARDWQERQDERRTRDEQRQSEQERQQRNPFTREQR